MSENGIFPQSKFVDRSGEIGHNRPQKKVDLPMRIAKRVLLFLLLNFCVVAMISVVLNLLGVRPYLTAHGLDVRSLLIFCLVWGMGGALISLALSRQMAKWMMGVEVIKPDSTTHANLVQMVYDLSHKAGLAHMPEVGIFRSNEPNAFATGPTAKKSLVAVSTGLLSRMNPNEIKGVIGHEISHIANGDMVTMTLLQGVVNAFVMFLARILAYVISTRGRGRNESSSYGSFMLFTYLFEIIFMILGSLVICAYSRFREFRADAGGAALAGRENMIGALEALRSLQTIHDPKADNPAIAAFKINRASRPSLLRFFATHPPLDERIERLKK
jgi:heat shock protein HtpX